MRSVDPLAPPAPKALFGNGFSTYCSRRASHCQSTCVALDLLATPTERSSHWAPQRASTLLPTRSGGTSSDRESHVHVPPRAGSPATGTPLSRTASQSGLASAVATRFSSPSRSSRRSRSGLFPWLWAVPRDVGFCTSDYECSLTGPHARTRLAPPPMGLCGCFLREASTNRPDPRHGPSSATEGSFRREDVLATSRPAVQEIRDH